MDSVVNVTSGELDCVSKDGENNSDAVSKFISSATFQTDGDHSVVETRDHFGKLNGDLNCEDFIRFQKMFLLLTLQLLLLSIKSVLELPPSRVLIIV